MKNSNVTIHSPESEHSTKPYFVVFGILLALSALTVMVSYIDFGAFHLAIALIIATIKAVCVILYFMHVIDSDKLIKLSVIGGFVWLGVLLALTGMDYLTRPWQYKSMRTNSWVRKAAPLFPSATGEDFYKVEEHKAEHAQQSASHH